MITGAAALHGPECKLGFPPAPSGFAAGVWHRQQVHHVAAVSRDQQGRARARAPGGRTAPYGTGNPAQERPGRSPSVSGSFAILSFFVAEQRHEPGHTTCEYQEGPETTGLAVKPGERERPRGSQACASSASGDRAPVTHIPGPGDLGLETPPAPGPENPGAPQPSAFSPGQPLSCDLRASPRRPPASLGASQPLVPGVPRRPSALDLQAPVTPACGDPCPVRPPWARFPHHCPRETRASRGGAGPEDGGGVRQGRRPH